VFGGEVTSLGGEFVGGEIPWWQGVQISDAQLTLKNRELNMMFTADSKWQRLPLIFYSFLVILK